MRKGWKTTTCKEVDLLFFLFGLLERWDDIKFVLLCGSRLSYTLLKRMLAAR